ncbi:MAG: hypothetical protein JNL23_06710 [Chitinophagaceae bacterium]|nr:hypothetical protein [Chitinophagaceae bacterium]
MAIASFGYLIIISLIDRYNLSLNNVITFGTITGTNTNQKHTCGGVDFTFFVSNKEYHGSTGYCDLSSAFCESLIGRKFPVIYCPKKISNNQMLLTKAMFKDYNVPYPDSLEWIEEYVR